MSGLLYVYLHVFQDEGEFDFGEARNEGLGSPEGLYTETVRSEWIDCNGHMN